MVFSFVFSGACCSYRLWPMQRRYRRDGNNYDILWDPRGMYDSDNSAIRQVNFLLQ